MRLQDNISHYMSTWTTREIGWRCEKYDSYEKICLDEFVEYMIRRNNLRYKFSIKRNVTYTKNPKELKINDLELSVRAHNLLINSGIKTIADLEKQTLGSLKDKKNIGIKTLNEIIDAMESNNLHLMPD